MYRIILFLVAFTITSYAQQFLLPNSIQWWHLTQASKDSLVVNAEAASADTIRNISSIVIKDSMDFDWLENSLNARKNLSPDSMGAATTTALADTADLLRDYIDNISLDSVNVDSAEITTWHIKNGTIIDEDISIGTLNNDKLQNSTIGVTAGSGLSGGSGSINLGASVSIIANTKNELQIKNDTIVFDTTVARTTILADDVIDAQHIDAIDKLHGLQVIDDDEWGVDAGDGLETAVNSDLDVLTGYGTKISNDSVAVDYAELEDTVIVTIKDTVQGANLTISGVWTFSQEPDFTSGLGDGNIDDNITASNYLLKADFGDSLNLNFGKLPDSINVVRNNRSIVLATAVIDSFQIVSAGKHFVGYLTQDIQIDTVFAVWDAGIGSNPSVDIMLKFGKNLGLTGTNIFSSDQTISSTSVGHKITSFSETTIGHGNMLWVTFPSILDKLDQLILVIIGKVTSNE